MNTEIVTPTAASVSPRPSLSMSVPMRSGYVLVALLLVLVVGWGGFAEISGAVLAGGRVAVESGPKRIQHKDGGIVSAVLVREGERVKAGQVLARLDATTASAYSAILDSQLWQARARRYRLEAETSGSWALAVPAGETVTPEYRALLDGERELLRRQKLLRDQRKAQLQEQIRQSEKEIAGLQSQLAAFEEQVRLKAQELISLRNLRADGYTTLTTMNAHEREAERLAGDRGEVAAAQARAKSQLSALSTQLLLVDTQAQKEAMTELSDVVARLGKLMQDSITARDTLKRIELVSPVDGAVQQIAIRTQDGVLGRGEVLMVVVPDQDALVVEALIDPRRIDQVRVGAKAYVRFTAFDANATPEATAVVDSLGADVETDEKTGNSQYRARLLLDRRALPRQLQDKLMAGMPVELQIETGSRSAISYLMKPLTDNLRRAFTDG